ncbi:TPA: IS3 family transposase, partial [Yersinia enterocolitica]
AANLLNRQFNPETLNTWWSGDITYLRTAQGWLYLAIVMDLCSRKIVSWAFSDKPDSDLTVRALRLAVNKRRPTGSVVFHSDQGAQYTSAQFQSCQQELDVTGSMSRKGNCLDNAVTERFFRSLKAERVNYRRYETRSQGIADVIDYIDSFYNLKRRHYRLGNISPDEY